MMHYLPRSLAFLQAIEAVLTFLKEFLQIMLTHDAAFTLIFAW